MIDIRRDDMCFACGKNNPIGLKLQFRWDGDELVTNLVPGREFQGYPGIVHGGIIGTVLDDLMANLLIQRGIPAVTASMSIQYRLPVPVGENASARARIVKDGGRVVDTEGDLRLSDGRVAASARARFVRLDAKGPGHPAMCEHMPGHPVLHDPAPGQGGETVPDGRPDIEEKGS